MIHLDEVTARLKVVILDEVTNYRDVLNEDPMLERLWQFLCAKHVK